METSAQAAIEKAIHRLLTENCRLHQEIRQLRNEIQMLRQARLEETQDRATLLMEIASVSRN